MPRIATDQWAKLNSKYKNKMLTIAKNATIAAGNEIIRRSPVDTGKFEESWVTAIGAPIESEGTTGAGLLPVVDSAKIGDVIFFTNSLPYNFKLEFGWSSQAPMGMVRIVAANWQGIVDKEVRKIANK